MHCIHGWSRKGTVTKWRKGNNWLGWDTLYNGRTWETGNINTIFGPDGHLTLFKQLSYVLLCKFVTVFFFFFFFREQISYPLASFSPSASSICAASCTATSFLSCVVGMQARQVFCSCPGFAADNSAI
ncbi:hypothetical protein QBC32DRAFT_107922 [Pseudoneurospora amorphoporcata]|uniref:Uncharacterized protein n=1 Tax=Pseudoneurospora amorphoporcata TaxID=241081 RepID=A0AAN6SAY8_9PEZI|nr:hypothetical protein QBC32DRAFT_107922 [Pseudoneurospora amorphoporcata]